jgi:AAA domain
MPVDVDAELDRIRRERRAREEAAGAMPPKARPKVAATPFVWRDPATIPPRAWLYGRHYIRKFVSCTVAPGSLGKSSLALVEAIAIARNLPLLGITPTEQTNAWYWNGEDPQDETERRIAAICQHYDIDGRELARHLFIDSGRVSPIKLARVAKGEVAFDDDLAEDICATIKQNNIGVFILDPFISTHGVPESDNTHIDAVVKKLAHIAEETNSALEFAHHVRKASNGQTETTAEDARGATAIINAVRSARVLNRMTKEQAAETRIAELRSYFRADNGKANLAPPGAAKWFHLTSVELANGDHVAVVEPWQFPSPMDGITTGHMHAIREKARTGDWRKDAKSDEWIGHAVADLLGLDADNPVDVKKIKAILSIWFDNKVLDTALRKDAHRKERQFVVPGNWNEDSL